VLRTGPRHHRLRRRRSSALRHHYLPVHDGATVMLGPWCAFLRAWPQEKCRAHNARTTSVTSCTSPRQQGAPFSFFNSGGQHAGPNGVETHRIFFGEAPDCRRLAPPQYTSRGGCLLFWRRLAPNAVPVYPTHGGRVVFVGRQAPSHHPPQGATTTIGAGTTGESPLPAPRTKAAFIRAAPITWLAHGEYPAYYGLPLPRRDSNHLFRA